jgi:TolA-binding protein
MAAKLLEKMSLNEAAEIYFERFVQQFPASPQTADALARLGALRGC